jgi:hypothetical protein
MGAHPHAEYCLELNNNLLSLQQLVALRPSDKSKIKVRRVMYRRNGSGLLSTRVLGPVAKDWISKVNEVLQECDPERYAEMYLASRPVVLSSGRVLDVGIEGVDGALFNGTFNYHILQAFASLAGCTINPHLDGNDAKNGVAVTTDGVSDPSVVSGGQFHVFDGTYTKPKWMKAKDVTPDCLDPTGTKFVSKPVGHTAIGPLHELWHFVSPCTLLQDKDGLRWSLIAQQKEDVIAQLAMFRANPDALIVDKAEKIKLRQMGLLPEPTSTDPMVCKFQKVLASDERYTKALSRLVGVPFQKAMPRAAKRRATKRIAMNMFSKMPKFVKLVVDYVPS